MVKFGKLFREFQIVEFKGNYIDYKKLKQNIKQIKDYLSSTSTGATLKSLSSSLKLKLRMSLQEDEYNANNSKLKKIGRAHV